MGSRPLGKAFINRGTQAEIIIIVVIDNNSSRGNLESENANCKVKASDMGTFSQRQGRYNC